MGRSKDNKYYFVYDGKFLQCNSLLEIKTDLEDNEWEQVVQQTIAAYAQLRAMNLSKSTKLEAKDKQVLANLQKSIDLIQNLDKTLYEKCEVDKLIDGYKEIIDKESERVKTVNIAVGQDNENADIVVSSLDYEDDQDAK